MPKELQGPYFAAETLRDPHYLAFVRGLVADGFELALHNATMGSSQREDIVRAFEFLQDAFGFVPQIHCNHGQNRDNLYWGPLRYRTSFLRVIAKALSVVRKAPRYLGEDQESPFFWGDLCKKHIRFVRGFAFARVNTDTLPPGRPYREPLTPWVNYWFTTSDAPDVQHFKRLMTTEAVDSLARDGGVCILSTHLGKGFVRDHEVDPSVEATLRHLAELPGWFAPVSDILEHLLAGSAGDIRPRERLQLELSHVLDRVTQGILNERRVHLS